MSAESAAERIMATAMDAETHFYPHTYDKETGKGEITVGDNVHENGVIDDIAHENHAREQLGANNDKSSSEKDAEYTVEPSQTPPQGNLSVDDKIIVDWDGPNDPHNPHNWSLKRKFLITFLVSMCTTSQYMGAAIFTPAAEQTQAAFHTSRTKNMLGLTLFVWGYGLGSLWFSPMSEIPVFRGRNPTYYCCQLIFAVLQIPTALVNHIASFAVLRFLAGIFASPMLSTAAATLGDIWEMPRLGIALAIWALGAICGPFLGPLVGAALVQHHPWRYIFWFLLAVSGGFFIILVALLRETNAQELLIRKAKRLRKETGSDKYIAKGEILASKQTAPMIIKEMFYRPIKLTIMEPILLLMDIHIGLVYSVLYLYMEAFPIAYMEMYGFNLVQMGAAFIPFVIGSFMGASIYLTYIFTNIKNLTSPERVFGPLSILGAVLLPSSLLVWGWLERSDIYWVIGMIGNLGFCISSFLLFQSYFGIIGSMFPPSVSSSAFASNNIVRSFMGGAFPLFGYVFYKHTGTERYPVGWGCTILAFISMALIPLPIYLTLRGAKLREYAQIKYGANRYDM